MPRLRPTLLIGCVLMTGLAARPAARAVSAVVRPSAELAVELAVERTVAVGRPQETGRPRPTLAPYVPTPQDVVERMLRLAGVTRSDVVYDLGSGDGRLVITAAKVYGARGVGIDIDPERIAESRANAKREGVEALVEFRQQDALQVDVSEATVVTLYLLSSANMKLRPILTRQLKPGSRIVSHQFGMGDWVPTATDAFTDALGASRVLYVWKVGG